MKKGICGITCVVSILLIIVAWQWNNSLYLTQFTSPVTCSSYAKGEECGVWVDGQCMSGNCSGYGHRNQCMGCTPKCQMGPLILGVGGVFLLLSSLGYLGYSCDYGDFSVGQSIRSRHSSRQQFGFRFY